MKARVSFILFMGLSFGLRMPLRADDTAGGDPRQYKPIDRKTLDLTLGLESPLKDEAQTLEAELLAALKWNEYVAALAPVVERINSRALAILQRQIQGSKVAATPGPEPVTSGQAAGGGIIPPAQGGGMAVAAKASWAGSDEAEVLRKYGNDRAALERNRKIVRELKSIYRTSQVAGENSPTWVPESLVERILEVHHIESLGQGGVDERSNMIVLTPTLHALMHVCEDARIDLKTGLLSIPSQGIERKIAVHADHNE